jgi:alkylation response protein AidB-like acyl-CoA dehydrogenase
VEFDWTEKQEEFRAGVRDLVDQYVPADWYMSSEQGDNAHAELSKRFVPELAERRWLTPHWPTEWGGRGDWWQHTILGEELWSRGEPRACQYMNVNWIAPILFDAGTEEQRDYHLGRILAGDVFWAQGFSEPDAGSDLAALRCRAVRDDDEYVINGQKIWTSYADLAEFIFLLVRTDPQAEPHAGISILIVPMDTAGIEIRDIPALGHIPNLIHEVFFRDVRVPVSSLLGQENEGWALIRKALAYERTGVPRAHAAGHVIDRAAAAAGEDGRLDDPDVLATLGEARAIAEAGKMLAYYVVDEKQRELPPSAAPNVSRAAGVQTERAAAEAALSVMGPEGLVPGSIADRQLTTAITAAVAAGAYDIQLNLISRLAFNFSR